MDAKSVSPRFDWRKSRKHYNMPTKYYAKYLETQKMFFKPKQVFHKRANFLFLTPSQKQCIKTIQEMIKISRTRRVSFNLSGYPGVGNGSLPYFLNCMLLILVNFMSRKKFHIVMCC